MKVLHIAGGAAKNCLYERLVDNLYQEGIEKQLLYAPVRTLEEALKQPIPRHCGVDFKYQFILKKYHRIFFNLKIKTITQNICAVDNPESYDIIHAHSLYSDGAVALKLSENTGNPFIIAVRNTDVNAFMRYRPDLQRYRNKILEKARKIIFISPAYYKKFFQKIDSSFHTALKKKAMVIPNGLSDDWFVFDQYPQQSIVDGKLRILYVGNFTKNKNVLNLLEAVLQLRDKGINATLTLVGEGGGQQGKITKRIKGNGYEFVSYLGKINEAERLKQIYRSHDIFAMPSVKETFGLVYIEAMSQGVPVVFSKGQGIDGFFPENTVAEATESSDSTAIALSIERLYERAYLVRKQCVTESSRFRWREIAKAYVQLYSNI